MTELSKRQKRALRRRRRQKWEERFLLVGCVYRTLYGLAVVAIWTAAASQWTATEAGVERTAQIGVGASLVVALVFVFGVLLRRSARSERQRKTDELERRWQERPAPITRPRHPDL